MTEYGGLDIDMKAALVSELIPLGLMHVNELLKDEVRRLASERYQRDGLAGHDLWSSLSYDRGLLMIIDGSKGFRKAIKEVFGRYGVVQRCQWHKRENIVSYLPKKLQTKYRQKLQAAYELDDYKKARAALLSIKRELRLLNESAVSSLEEGFEESLSVQRLGLSRELRRSLKTSNIIESILSQVASKMNKVDYWKNSNQKHPWIASALLAIEPKLNRISGYRQLKTLRTALQMIIPKTGRKEIIAA